MNVGFFAKKEDGTLYGHLPTMNLHGVSIEPLAKTDKGPDYIVSVEGAELGTARRKTSQKGKAYVSCRIVRPSEFPVWRANMSRHGNHPRQRPISLQTKPRSFDPPPGPGIRSRGHLRGNE